MARRRLEIIDVEIKEISRLMNEAEQEELKEPFYVMVDIYSECPDDDGYYNIIGQRKEYV